MKTIHSVQKTENRNSKTSVMKTLVVLTGVALFSFTTNASAISIKGTTTESDKHLYTYTSLAYRTPTSKALYLTEAAMEISTEESLEVESWMINESIFTSPLPVEETEESLEVESWMLNGEQFIDTLNTQESEKTLEVEPWMLNESIFGN